MNMEVFEICSIIKRLGIDITIVKMGQEGMLSEPKLSDFKIKKDGYRKARGGNSELLDIACTNCNERLMIYQKDGIGGLLRSYLDRILWPPTLASLSTDPSIQTTRDMKNLTCDHCGTLIGVPMEYASEKRLAYRLIKGKFKKQKFK